MMKQRLLFASLVAALLLTFLPASASPARAADGVQPWAQELAEAIELKQVDRAHALAREILGTKGYKQTGSSAVDWFLDYERANILGKVQQETVAEIVARHGDDALEGIVNIGSHARPMNPKFVPGKSDVDFIFLGERSAEADELFRLKLAQEMGLDDTEKVLELTKIGPSNDRHFNKLQQVKSFEESLAKGRDDIYTFLQRLKDPQYAEYYKTYGADKYIENYNWQAGSYDRISVGAEGTTIIRDPGTTAYAPRPAEIGQPTRAMRALYESKGWKIPELTGGDAWGLATNEYYFMQRELEQIGKLTPYEQALKLAKRAERLNEALALTGMQYPDADFIARTDFLRKGGVISDEAAAAYLSQLDEMTELTLQRTLKAKIYDDLSRSWHPDWLGKGLEDEALDATIKFAETRKFLETSFGMNLIGRNKSKQLLDGLDVPKYFRGAIGEEYARAQALSDDAEQLARYIENHAASKTALIEGLDGVDDTARAGGFMKQFLNSPGGRMTLEGLDIGFRLYTVYDAYERGGWNAAGNRVVLEGGAKWLAWKGISRADLALLAFDVSTMTIQAVGDAAMEEMRDDNVMGIYTGVVPQREAGLLFIGLKKDAAPDYTSLFQHLDISGLSDDVRGQVRSRLDGSEGFNKFIEEKTSWWEYAFGMTDERKEEIKDIYVSLLNVNHMRGQLFGALHDDFEARVNAWNSQHGASVYAEENAAELDALIGGLIDDVLGEYRRQHLAEIEAGGAWKGLDEAAWARIRSMVAADFQSGWGTYLEAQEEARQQELFQRETQQMAGSGEFWLDAILGAGEGAATPPASILEMLETAFGSAPAATGGFKVSVTPQTAAVGDMIEVDIDLGQPVSATAEITLESAAGESFTTRTAIPGDGRLSLPVLEITPGNLGEWAGRNTVTVAVTIGDGQEAATQKASAAFTVVGELSLTVTATPETVTPGDEVTFEVAVLPPQPAEITFQSLELEIPGPVTSEDGYYRFTVDAPAGVSGASRDYFVIAAARAAGGQELQASGGFTVISELGLRFGAEPRQAAAGDTVWVSGRVNPEIPAALEVTVRNDASGYTTTFNDFTAEDGTFEIPVLEIDTGNLASWRGGNTVTIAARADAGAGSLTAEHVAYFTVASDYAMTLAINPQTAIAGEEVTVKVQVTPPLATPLEVSGDVEEPFRTQTDGSGRAEFAIPVTSFDEKLVEVHVAAPELGLSRHDSFYVEQFPLLNAEEANFSLGPLDGTFLQIDDGVESSVTGEAGYGYWFRNGSWDGDVFTAVSTPDAGSRFTFNAVFDAKRENVLGFEMTAEQGLGTDEGFYFRVTGHEVPYTGGDIQSAARPYELNGAAACGRIDTIERRSWRPGWEYTLLQTQCRDNTRLYLAFN